MVDKQLRHLANLDANRKSCSPEMLQNALKAFGFKRVRQRGSHATWRHQTGLKIVVPMHRPVKRFYVDEVISICKEIRGDPSSGGGEQE